jgi:hypothetical protein
MVAMLIGCGLRRAELLALRLEWIQQREEHSVIADLVGKGGHVQTVPIPTWVKAAVDAWTAAAGMTVGPVFRAINKAGRVWGDGMSPKVLWDVVRTTAARADIDKLAPHDPSAPVPVCATWPAENWTRFSSCSATSPSMTERYLGCKQKLRIAVTTAWESDLIPFERACRQGGCFIRPGRRIRLNAPVTIERFSNQLVSSRRRRVRTAG